MTELLAVLTADSNRVAELADAADLTADVPSCPGWTLRDLVVHLGEVQRFWAANIRAADPASPWSGETVPPPAGDVGGWFRSGSTELVEALQAAAPGAPCWTWWGAPMTAGAVGRHQVQEAAVHRWDAQAAGGSPAPIDAAAAHDGVSEFLEIVLAADAERLPQAVELTSSDTGGRWPVGDGVPAATVTATASDLVLLLYGRIGEGDVSIEGATQAVAALLEAIDTE